MKHTTMAIVLAALVSGCTSAQVAQDSDIAMQELSRISEALTIAHSGLDAQHIARSHVRSGRLIVLEGGLVPYTSQPVYDELKRKYGIDWICIAQCSAPQEVFAFLSGYNRVSLPAIRARWNMPFHEIVEAVESDPEVQKQVELFEAKSEKERAILRAREQTRLQPLKDNVWKLFAASRMREAAEFWHSSPHASLNIIDLYEEYLRETVDQNSLSPAEFDVATFILVAVEYDNAAVGDVIAFLTEIQQEQRPSGQVYTIIPELDSALLACTISSNGDFLSLAEAVRRIADAVGGEFEVRQDHIVIRSRESKKSNNQIQNIGTNAPNSDL
jgi:hypothetical protein